MSFIGIFCLMISIFLFSGIIFYQFVLLMDIKNQLDIIENKILNIENEIFNDDLHLNYE